MREIGGYIELDKGLGDEYHKKAIALNSGRHCLEYLIRTKNIKKIYLPFFLCASVAGVCRRLSCETDYYNIDEKFTPIFNQELQNKEYIYIVNYYGQLDNKVVFKYQNKYKNIIVDNSQAFFQYPVEGIDTIYTCRKFFGVSDGGYLYTDSRLDIKLPLDKSYDRIRYILGRFEMDAGTFYKESVDNNKFFADEELKGMSKLTHNLLRNLNYEFIKNRRRENFEVLHNFLKKHNKSDIKPVDGAFMYPLYIRNGNELKRKLIQKKIFVPTLWSDVFNVADKDTIEWDFAENIVPLPIDQRYDTDDMMYIIENVLEELK